MKSAAPILAAVLLLASGYVHGMWTGRWQATDSLESAAAAVQRLPQQFNDWEVVSETKVTAEEQTIAELAGSVSRQYRHARTGDVVTVLLMVGKPGPISVHSPTACYTGQGYQQDGAIRIHRCDVAQQGHQFQTAQFHSPNKSETLQPRVYWGWSAGDVWSCPESPRLAFVGQPALYKLYVAFETGGSVKAKTINPAERMLQDLIPVIKQSVFAPATHRL